METKYLFTGMILCKNCGYKYKSKMDRQSKVYLCGNYSKNGLKSGCTRRIIHESILEEIIKSQFQIYKIEYLPNNEYLKTIIEKITIDENSNIAINYFNHNSTISSPTQLIYGLGITDRANLNF